MLYLAVGDHKNWERYSKKKQAGEWTAETDGFSFVFKNRYSISWKVRRSCTVTHLYYLNEYDDIISKARMGRSYSLLRGDTFEVPRGGATLTTHDNANSNEPYLV